MSKNLSSEKIWTRITIFAAMVSAICASLAVYQTASIWKTQYESKKPYFTLEKPGFEETNSNPPYQMRITTKNIGYRPASNLKGKIFVFEKPFAKGAYYISNFSSVNDISPSNSPTWRLDIEGFTSLDVPFQYYVIALKYSDAITKQNYNQVFYLNWGGLKDGQGYAGFSHASPENAIELNQTLGKTIFDF